MNRSDILFLTTIIIDLSLLIAAIMLLRRKFFTPPSYWLLTYAVISTYTDYTVAMVKIDRLLSRGGSLWQTLVLPPNVNFALDLVAHAALLIAICLCISRLAQSRRGLLMVL
jgi:hypothetical protein